MESADENTYLLVVNGKPEGPFSLLQLQEFKIQPGDFVKTRAMDDYKEAHEIAELRNLLGFSKPVVVPQYFAGFDQRLLASVLDWFFISGACILIAFIITFFIADKDARLFIALALILIIPAVKLVYHIILESRAKQGTLGKQLLKIKVCDLEGNQITLARSAGRNLAKLFSAAPLFLGYLSSFFNKQQQCVHDMLAGTLVIKDRLI